jgi:hypothetical protein
VKLDASNKNPKNGLRSILKGWLNSFRELGSMMLSKEEGFWLNLGEI